MTNSFLAFGIAGGLLALVLLVILLVRAFKDLGKALAIARHEQRKEHEVFYWSLAVVIAVHATNWLGITYFDQTSVLWFFQLALISTLTQKAILGVIQPAQIGIQETRSSMRKIQLRVLPIKAAAKIKDTTTV